MHELLLVLWRESPLLLADPSLQEDSLPDEERQELPE